MVKEASSSLLSVLLVGRELLHSMSDWWVEEAWGSITTRPPLKHYHCITLHYSWPHNSLLLYTANYPQTLSCVQNFRIFCVHYKVSGLQHKIAASSIRVWQWMLEGSVQWGESPWKHSSGQILRTILTKDQIQNFSQKSKILIGFKFLLVAKFSKYFTWIIFKWRTR